MENYNRELCEERHARTEAALEKHEAKLEDLEKCTSQLKPKIELQSKQCEESRREIDKMQKSPAIVIGKAISHIISVMAGALAIWILQLLGIG